MRGYLDQVMIILLITCNQLCDCNNISNSFYKTIIKFFLLLFRSSWNIVSWSNGLFGTRRKGRPQMYRQSWAESKCKKNLRILIKKKFSFKKIITSKQNKKQTYFLSWSLTFLLILVVLWFAQNKDNKAYLGRFQDFGKWRS